MSLLTVGSVAFDAIETPYGKTDKIIGGAATYISLAASYFIQPVHLVAVVGNDFPQQDINTLQQHGVNTDGLQIRPDQKSFFWSGRYHDNMNRRDTLVTELNVLADFDPILPTSCQQADFLMLGNLTPDTQRLVLQRMARRPKLVVMDTMNFWMDVAWDSLMQTLQLVDVLVINDEEARQLSGKYPLVRAAARIRSMGPKYVIIKKGEHGALLFYEDKIFSAPALPLATVYDPTGAGDTFAGGFIGYLAKHNDISLERMKSAVIYGSAMASFCVEKFGPERLMHLHENEIRERVQRFADLAHFAI